MHNQQPLLLPQEFLASTLHCADLVESGEHELAAFIRAVTESYGPSQARLAANDWITATMLLDCQSDSPRREWLLVTMAAAMKLADRLRAEAATPGSTISSPPPLSLHERIGNTIV